MKRNARLQLRYELLESRVLLSADLEPASVPLRQELAPPITWFELLADVERVSLQDLASVDSVLAPGEVGPLPLAVGEWLVQLTEASADTVRRLHAADSLLDDDNNDFTIISGLGTAGSILIRGEGSSRVDIEDSLRQNENVESFSLNQLIRGQQTLPNDPEFVAGLLPGLERIGAKNAWDVSRGSLSTVVGVVDTGIDSTHPDLYLNIWLNQGELPPKYLDDDGNKLTDIDSDGLITFYDLNNATRLAATPYTLTVGGFASGPNAEFVRDLNNNGRIDAQDLLADANWADGRDSDNNGFFDDFFGVNFRSGAGDPFASNNPSDPLGHGTHVSGTIGAIGGNGSGVVGVNWQTSLMSLRILDNNNQGDSGSAIRALNYAREMRARLTTNSANRVTEGANVRVLNNSWGQPGGFEASLDTAISDAGKAGILFVAAAGNGNILGTGVDNDRTPFYPASYDSANVIAVAASDVSDRLASFSNFGSDTVDILSPGVGIRSTLPGGGYGIANGTSMATPHVAGTAALIWAALSEATVDEVKQAILGTTTPIAQPDIVSTNGSLNAIAAINADVFAPAARLIAKQDITTSGGTGTEFTVEYNHRSGIDISTLGNNDLIVTRQWGPAEELAALLKPDSILQTPTTATATYVVSAPGSYWDAFDFGDYAIRTAIDGVKSLVDNQSIQLREIGRFNVRINDDPSVIYADDFADSLDSGTLRSAIIAANDASPSSRTIILESGKYAIGIPAVADPASSFGASLDFLGINNPGGWSNQTTGDFDILGNISIVGDLNDETVIDAGGLDRGFKVNASAELKLSRLTVLRGRAPANQGGGSVLSIGDLSLDQVIIRDNGVIGSAPTAGGGGIAIWAGNAVIDKTWITENVSNFGAGIYFAGESTGILQRSTLSQNSGGGLLSLSANTISVENSTFSGNTGSHGAVATGVDGNSEASVLSANGRFVTFASLATNLVGNDTNQVSDVFVYDRQLTTVERVSINNDGVESNAASASPSISGDGRYVTFTSEARNLVSAVNNGNQHVFVYDRMMRTIERISISDTGVPGNGPSFHPSISEGGRYVTFSSIANNLVPADNDNGSDIFVFDRTLKKLERVSINDDGTAGNRPSTSPSISADSRYVTFASTASNLTNGDHNGKSDVFVYDRTLKKIQRISVSNSLQEGDDASDLPSMSADGRFVTFRSEASNLVAGDNNDRADIFVYDRATNNIERVSLNDNGIEGDEASSSPSLSGDGRYITFESLAGNLVPNDNNGHRDIFIYDRINKKIDRVNVNSDQGEADGSSTSPTLSNDGRYIAFTSVARNLAVGDQNGKSDVFIHDRTLKTTVGVLSDVPGSIDISHGTVVRTSQALAAISGNVLANDSLFGANAVTNEINTPIGLGRGSVRIADADVNAIGPLTRLGNLPPVHPLLLGNPAIDGATTEGGASQDQLGQTRQAPDAGAVEATFATVLGKTYVDTNRNAKLDVNELGLAGVTVALLDLTPLRLELESRSSASIADDPRPMSIDKTGQFEFDRLPPGTYSIEAIPEDGWSLSTQPTVLIRNVATANNGDSFSPTLSADGRFVTFESNASTLASDDNNGVQDVFIYERSSTLVDRVSVNAAGEEGNAASIDPSVNADGRYVAFSSLANNLVADDRNMSSDIFVFDRTLRTVDRVSVNDAGEEGNSQSTQPSISADGRYVAFRSNASNLADDDHNGKPDVFVFDRTMRTIKRVSINKSGDEANDVSDSPFLSADGRFVAFDSFASNLVPGDNSGKRDVFVYDLNKDEIERISVGRNGIESNNPSITPSLSANGRYVTFTSFATNLVTPDTNLASDIFVYDRESKSVERVSVDATGMIGNKASISPSLSADGRYVTYSSISTNLVPGDANNRSDVFVYDRTTKAVSRISVNDAGEEGNDESFTPSLTADGRFIAFFSRASNLHPADSSDRDNFIVPNPLIAPSIQLNLRAGERITNLNVGLIPDPGVVEGVVFEDIVSNGVYDAGEMVFPNVTVFLDLDTNGAFDDAEPSVMTDGNGNYQFTNIDAHRAYSIQVQSPVGFEQLVPNATEHFAWNVFLPAAGTLSDRNFALRRATPSGQSSASAVSGRLFDDRNDNGVFDAGVDVPVVSREVFLDATNFGVRDSNEPRVLTDSQGFYTIDGLSSRIVAVSTTLDTTIESVAPLGSSFSLQTFPLFDDVEPFANPQAIGHGDFNADGFQDVVVALGEGNAIAIRLNDNRGGFLLDEIDVQLGSQGAGPTAMVVGQFDADAKLDVALTANYAGNVTVLLNFDPASNSFASRSFVKVGQEPLDLASGQFGGEGRPDLIIVNKADSTVQVLTNDGSGVFMAGAAIQTGGRVPVSLVAANFTGDAAIDVAVVHASPRTNSTPFGGVTVLTGNGSGGLRLEPAYYPVGALPIDSVSADFNNDGLPDLAVANFSSNSISVLLGHADGTFRVQNAILGTASGAFDIALGDVDNDGDIDVIASNLRDRNISIFRNIGAEALGGDVRFEPLENIGLGQFSMAQRMPLVVANFDNDLSGPNRTGTLDIVAIPQQTDALHVLKNRLVNGSHRVALTGLNRITGLDFIVKSSTLPPSFHPIADPLPIAENAPQQSVAVVGVQKGRSTGPALRFSATQSNPNLLTTPTITYVDGSSEAILRYAPKFGVNGKSIITVRVVDAGADGVFENSDDTVFESSFTVVVLATIVRDRTRIVLQDQGEVFDMRDTLNQLLSTISEIDIRGVGSNQLILDATKVSQVSPDKRLLVFAGSDDIVTFGSGWKVDAPEIVGGAYTHILTASTASIAEAEGEEQRGRLELRNNLPLQNPLQAADADRNGAIQPLDALRVINELRRRGSGPVLPPTNEGEISKLYFDVSGDNTFSALDALRAINALSRINRGGSPEGARSPRLVDLDQFGALHSEVRRDDRAEELDLPSTDLQSAPMQSSQPPAGSRPSQISAIDAFMQAYGTDDDADDPSWAISGSLKLMPL